MLLVKMNDIISQCTALYAMLHDVRGVRLAKNDFGSVFGSVLKKNCGFRFGFTKGRLFHEQVNLVVS